MEEQIKIVLDLATQKMDKTIEHMEREMAKVRAGKANPRMLDGIVVDYYGTMTPLSQAANINTPDPRTIAIQPWDNKLIPIIEKAIMAANLGMNPENNGQIVRINVPALTEERRKELVKMTKKISEDSRIGIRTIRRESIEELKKLKKDGLPEDLEKDAEDKTQKLTDTYMTIIDEMLAAKEKDIMTV